MSNHFSMTQNPNGYNRTPDPTHKRQAAQLATSPNVAERTFLKGTDSASQHLVLSREAATWPPLTKPAHPTDQQSAALTPYQLRLLIEGEASPFREISPHTHPETDSQVSHSELLSLYIMPCRCERTTDTFGKKIVDELFTLHLGNFSLNDERNSTGYQMQYLHEAFVDTFGETDTHLLFVDTLTYSSEEVFA